MMIPAKFTVWIVRIADVSLNMLGIRQYCVKNKVDLLAIADWFISSIRISFLGTLKHDYNFLKPCLKMLHFFVTCQWSSETGVASLYFNPYSHRFYWISLIYKWSWRIHRSRYHPPMEESLDWWTQLRRGTEIRSYSSEHHCMGWAQR